MVVKRTFKTIKSLRFIIAIIIIYLLNLLSKSLLSLNDTNIVNNNDVVEIHPPLKNIEYQPEVPRLDIPDVKNDNATKLRLRLNRRKRIKRCLYRFDERMGKQ